MYGRPERLFKATVDSALVSHIILHENKKMVLINFIEPTLFAHKEALSGLHLTTFNAKYAEEQCHAGW